MYDSKEWWTLRALSAFLRKPGKGKIHVGLLSVNDDAVQRASLGWFLEFWTKFYLFGVYTVFTMWAL